MSLTRLSTGDEKETDFVKMNLVMTMLRFWWSIKSTLQNWSLWWPLHILQTIEKQPENAQRWDLRFLSFCEWMSPQVDIDRVYIGSCTGGKTEDFFAAAKLFHKAKEEVKVSTFLVPATQKVL